MWRAGAVGVVLRTRPTPDLHILPPPCSMWQTTSRASQSRFLAPGRARHYPHFYLHILPQPCSRWQTTSKASQLRTLAPGRARWRRRLSATRQLALKPSTVCWPQRTYPTLSTSVRWPQLTCAAQQAPHQQPNDHEPPLRQEPTPTHTLAPSTAGPASADARRCLAAAALRSVEEYAALGVEVLAHH